MQLLTWNVAGRVKRRGEQVEAVLGAGADVVALQEVTPTTADGWVADLGAAGYAVATTGAGPRPEGRRRLGVLVAARGGLEPLAGAEVPWPERLLVARTGGAEVWNLHSPISPSPDLAKVRTHEAVHAALTGAKPALRVLCGDLNRPRDVSWAWPHGGGWRLDHVLVSPGVEPRACEYLHAWRREGLSDHSALVAELDVTGG